MANKRRDRQRRPGRREAYRSQKPIILILTEGKNTEPQYLNGIKMYARNSRVDIEISNTHGVPFTLVKRARDLKKVKELQAKQERDENLKYDAVWCVFDIDDHPNLLDAKQMANDNSIDLAISNPCFELWLLLHFRENPGMQHRDAIREMLKEFVPGYNKKIDIAVYMPSYNDAVVRATRMDEEAQLDGEEYRNPTTNVYELTMAIVQEQ